MIVLVDDDDVMLEVSAATLTESGFDVQSFQGAGEALAFLEGAEPELIISDLIMPEIDGFGFREAYLEKYPERGTPFLFLSSVSDPDIIVEGLTRGADDYLVKPVDHRVLAAKVKSLLKRKVANGGQLFKGELSQFPLSKVMKFCELKGITGSVQVSGPGVATTLPCRGGNFLFEEQSDADFEKAFDLESGSFVIRVDPVDYSDLGGLPDLPQRTAPAAVSLEAPTGALSGVRVKDRLFQVQSEYIEPGEQVVTLVILDGKVKLKRAMPAPLSLGKAALQRLLEEQHASIEREIQDKLNEKVVARQVQEVSPKERFNALLEEGFDHYREGGYARAEQAWEEAAAINPTDKVVQANLKIVRKKLGA